MRYLAGRAFQILGLLVMPSAVWVGEIGRDERGMITIFTASLAVFFLGLLLTRLSSKA